MTSPSEDRLRRAVDDMLTVCWNEGIPLLEALGEALDDWLALSAVEFEGPALDSAVGCAAPVDSLRGAEQVVAGRPGLSVECAVADALADWVADRGEKKSARSPERQLLKLSDVGLESGPGY